MFGKCKLLFLIFAFFLSFAAQAEEKEFVFHLEPRPVQQIAFEKENGNRIRLSDFKGGIVLLNFWGTFCAPCIGELESLDRLNYDLGSKITIIPLSVGKEDGVSIRNFFIKHEIKYLDSFTDRTRNLMEAMRVTNIPTTILINTHGAEIARLVGATDFSSPYIRSQLNTLLRTF